MRVKGQSRWGRLGLSAIVRLFETSSIETQRGPNSGRGEGESIREWWKRTNVYLSNTFLSQLVKKIFARIRGGPGGWSSGERK